MERVRSKVNFEEHFYRVRGKTAKPENQGKILGFPIAGRGWCKNILKVAPIWKATKGDCISYVGIAVDEPKRVLKKTDKEIMPLVDYNVTEEECFKICRELDLLSPIYTDTNTRGGCWFCYNQPINSLRDLRHDYPEYWELMLKWDKDSLYQFRNECTVAMLDKRFEMEDKGLVPNDRTFRWYMIE